MPVIDNKHVRTVLTAEKTVATHSGRQARCQTPVSQGRSPVNMLLLHIKFATQNGYNQTR